MTINVSSTGTVRVNNPQSVNTPGVQATLLLPTPSVSDSAPVTTITAGRFNVGDNGAFNNVSTQINAVVLGTGLTTINATNVNIGTGNRDIGSLTFAGSGGNITIRAPDGVSRCAAFNVASGGGST
ncbi:MAG: hypothetical protein NTY53_22480, partial [Kiritimatiellaeota bacterium]|nr:hypothetical protein [Kiritimatiellota bacterium]